MRLLLIDGHNVVAEALATLIDAEPDIDVVARVASMSELNEGFDADFDVVLTRFLLPDGNGADATRLVKRRWPHVKVVVLSAVNDPSVMARIRRAGVDAFVGRDGSMSELIAVLRATYRAKGSSAATAPARASAGARRQQSTPVGPDEPLTPRELDVLTALAHGRTSGQICAEMGIGQNTLRTHVQKIIGKLNVHSRLEAVARAQREGLV